MKKKFFPCPVCKGRGEFIEDRIDYWTITTPCYYCEEEGMIEIGGKIHMDRKAEKLGMNLMNEGREYSMEEIRQMGYAAMHR